MLRSRRALLTVGTAVFLSSTYFTYVLSSKNNNNNNTNNSRHDNCCSTTLFDSGNGSDSSSHDDSSSKAQQKYTSDETRAIYNSLASSYDKKVQFDEFLIGVTKLRKKIFNTPAPTTSTATTAPSTTTATTTATNNSSAKAPTISSNSSNSSNSSSSTIASKATNAVVVDNNNNDSYKNTNVVVANPPTTIKSYQVKGPNVLEVAAGTGRNIDFVCQYLVTNPSIAHVQITDNSSEMIQQAYRKFAQWQKSMERRKKLQTLHESNRKIHFSLADAHTLSDQLPKKFYDTVIDTYGMCSFEDPEKVLREMVKVCKPDGKIILLEHGRTVERRSWIPFYRSWLNNYLDRTAPKRAKDWGCWWNRDIESIVQKCSDVLYVESVEYHQLGTCYLIVARPKYLHEKPLVMEQREEMGTVANLFATARQAATSAATTKTTTTNSSSGAVTERKRQEVVVDGVSTEE